jgi:hypothetical protein
MDLRTLERTAFCGICGKQFLKNSNGHKYCSAPCALKAQRAHNREWLIAYKRRLREEHYLASSTLKATETIEEVVAKANAAGMTYGKYVALQRELEGCEIYGSGEVD